MLAVGIAIIALIAWHLLHPSVDLLLAYFAECNSARSVWSNSQARWLLLFSIFTTKMPFMFAEFQIELELRVS